MSLVSYDECVLTDDQLEFGDELGGLLARLVKFPPVAGRVLAILLVADPPAQSINELAAALQVSRSAITQAVVLLERQHLARRSRARGERMDRVRAVLDVSVFESDFDPTGHLEQARLIRRALELLPPDDASGRRERLAEAAALNEFFAEKYPALGREWQERLRRLRAEHGNGAER